MSSDDEFQRLLFEVLDRLVLGGFATGWKCDTKGDVSIQWDEDVDDGRGGMTAYFEFLERMMRMFPDRAVTTQDLTMLVLAQDLAVAICRRRAGLPDEES